MKERYEVIKGLYPNYLILFIKEEKQVSIGIDKDIINNFDTSNTNKIILNNLDIVDIYESNNNDYIYLYIKIKLIRMVLEYEKKNRNSKY